MGGWFLLHRLFLIVLLLVPVSGAPWDLGSGADRTALAAEVRNPDGVAVIVGNKDYSDVGDVAYAHRDAQAIHHYVIDVLGFDPRNVRLVTDADFGQMRSLFGTEGRPGILGRFVEKRRELSGGENVSDVVVFYSGHGMPSLNQDEAGSYMLGVNANPNNPALNGYSVEELYRILDELPARSVSVFLDACFSGVGGDGRPLLRASPTAATRLPENVSENTVVFAAAEAQQVAFWDDEAEHGLFTHHLLDALYGGGDEDGDGRVTAGEAHRYLAEHVWYAALDRENREQDVVLLDGTGTGATVLAAAVDGAFPARPQLDAPESALIDGGPGGDDGTDREEPPTPSLDLAAVTGGKSFLLVESTPSGAAVLLDGAMVGETPVERYDLRAGTYTVTLDHPTHETVVLESQALTEREVLHIQQALKPASGKVTVITRPSGAWVEHEGTRLAESTPATLKGLSPGPLVLVLGAEGHRPERVEVRIPKGGVALIKQELEEVRYGTLTLELEPADAQVVLPDIVAPYRAGMKLAEGELRVRVSREGYPDASRVVAISGNTRERIVLEQVPRPFTVVTTPADAAVRFADGSDAYRPGMALLPGTYRVRVSAEGWETQEATVRHGTAPTRHLVTLKRQQDPDKGSPPPSITKPADSEPPPDILVRLVKAGDIDGLKAALAAGAGVHIDQRDDQGWTALMHAANKGYALLVPSLLDAGPDLDVRAADGATALFIAVLKGDEKIARMLARAGANASITGPRGKTPLDVAKFLELDQTVVLLKEVDADRTGFFAAQKADTADAYNRYLTSHPNGLFVNEARQLRDAALDREAFQRAKAANTARAFRAYLADFPAGTFRDEAAQLVTILDTEEFNAAVKVDSAAAYARYVLSNPDGLFIEDAKRRERMARDRETFSQAKARNTIDALEAYLAAHPDGAYRTQAQDIIRRLKDPIIYAQAEKAHTIDAYKNYLTLYPDGTYAKMARYNLAELTVVGRAFSDCTDCPTMVVIPAGSFVMGSDNGKPREKPRYRVTISQPFAVGKYEVTFKEFERFVLDTNRDMGVKDGFFDLVTDPCSSRQLSVKKISWRKPGFEHKDMSPAVCVNWNDAVAYVEWLSKQTGEPYRLLSESEWEYAVRAGSGTDFYFGDCISVNQANYNSFHSPEFSCDQGSRGKTTKVGSFPPNDFGLHDMHGNAFEWVEDCWHENYKGAPKDGRAWTWDGDCSARVIRGGSWFNSATWLRSASRAGAKMEKRYTHYGLRVARVIDPPALLKKLESTLTQTENR